MQRGGRGGRVRVQAPLVRKEFGIGEDVKLVIFNFGGQPPAQELQATDLHDNTWTFRHIYRGQPKQHLLTTGWSLFVSGKRLFAGVFVLFIRDLKGNLLLGIRRAQRQPTNISSPVLSSDSMHIYRDSCSSHACCCKLQPIHYILQSKVCMSKGFGCCSWVRHCRLKSLYGKAAVKVAEQGCSVPPSKDIHPVTTSLLDTRLSDGAEVEMEVIPMGVNCYEISNAFISSPALVVDEPMLQKILGPPRFDDTETAERVASPGGSVGLVWTAFGGERNPMMMNNQMKVANGQVLSSKSSKTHLTGSGVVLANDTTNQTY